MTILKICPFCGGEAAPLDANDHTWCTNIACGSTSYIHRDAWNNARPFDSEDQEVSFVQTAYDQGRADALEQLSTQIAPLVHLIEVFCKDMTERNWADKADYINQQAGRIRYAIGGYDGHPVSEEEEDYRRAAEADFQSHVSFLKREREWG